MASANLVVLIGNLTRNPEVRSTSTGSAVTTLSLAVNRRVKDSSTGDYKEVTDFINVTVWGRQAENCEKYLTKGRGVYIEGRLQQNRWEDPSGEQKSRLEVVASTVQFLPGGSKSPSGASGKPAEESYDSVAPADDSAIEDNDEEIPF